MRKMMVILSTLALVMVLLALNAAESYASGPYNNYSGYNRYYGNQYSPCNNGYYRNCYSNPRYYNQTTYRQPRYGNNYYRDGYSNQYCPNRQGYYNNRYTYYNTPYNPRYYY